MTTIKGTHQPPRLRIPSYDAGGRGRSRSGGDVRGRRQVAHRGQVRWRRLRTARLPPPGGPPAVARVTAAEPRRGQRELGPPPRASRAEPFDGLQLGRGPPARQVVQPVGDRAPLVAPAHRQYDELVALADRQPGDLVDVAPRLRQIGGRQRRMTGHRPRHHQIPGHASIMPRHRTPYKEYEVPEISGTSYFLPPGALRRRDAPDAATVAGDVEVAVRSGLDVG